MRVIDSATPVVGDGLFSTDPPSLLGARCVACGQVSFPAPGRCPFCRSAEVELEALPTSGTVYSYTISRIPAPGYRGPVPYGFGLVDLGDVVRVASLLAADPLERLHIGARVHLALVDVGGDQGPLASFIHVVEDL